ncbi:transposase [Streptomyces mirabilis]|uniref:transposase n=1 Tax=Streptomyces mirabilis TaxID=68239 RepID=UPI00369504BB
MDPTGHQVGQRRFVVNAGTFRQLLRWCEQWPERRFAVEGARGLGRTLAAAAMKSIRPETATDTCRRDIARDLLSDLRRLDRQVKENEAEMRDALAATGTPLITLPGLGTVMAAEIIGHVGDIDRFPTEHHFASYTGGIRALNSVLHVIAVCQIRDGGHGQEYYLRKIAEGKTPAEARRALKRRLSNVVYRIMKRDLRDHLAQAA